MNIKHLREMNKKYGVVSLVLFGDGAGFIASEQKELFEFDVLQELEDHLTPTENASAVTHPVTLCEHGREKAGCLICTPAIGV